MARAFQATRLLRQGLAMAAGSPLEREHAVDVFREAYRLNPKDRDLALLIGTARPRLRTGGTR
jgi:cytochrome c-type biogenesis protein CcmH/NrfG